MLAALLILAGTAPAQNLTVSGTVVTPRGDRGVAGATVELEELLPPHRLAERQLAGELRPKVVRRARTGGLGGFSLDAPGAGFWRLVVRHADFLPAAVELAPLLAERSLDPLRVQPRSELAARVFDVDGRPMAGATLIAAGWSEAWSEAAPSGWRPAERLAESDAGGWAALPCASSETLTVIALMGDRYARRETECGAMLLDLTLEATLSRARLLDAGGAPAAAVYGFFRRPLLAFGVSDRRGDLQGPFATPEAVPLAFADAAAFYGAPSWLPPAADDAGAPAALKLPAAADVAGEVLDAFDESPLDGVWVWLDDDARRGEGAEPPADSPPYFQRVDRGAFDLRLPGRRPPAPRRLVFGGPGYITSEYPAPANDPYLAVRLSPAMTLPGRAIDAGGAGIEGVAVAGRKIYAGFVRWHDRGDGGRWRLDPIAGMSDAGGFFELSGIPPRWPLELVATKAGYAGRYTSAPPLVPGVPAEELVIVLERGIDGAGRVVTESGLPIAGAEVALLPALTGAAEEQSYEVKTNYRSTTDSDGGFTLRDLPAGRFFLSARAAGYPELLVPGVEVAAGAGQPVDLGTAVLVPGVALAGRVQDPDGRPVAAAELSLRDADGEPIVIQRAASPWFASTASRADGGFEISGLPPDRRLVLLAVADGFLPREMALTTTGEDQRLEVEMERGATVTGVVIDERGRPAPGARVEFQAGSDLRRLTTAASRSAEAGADGRFEILGLRPGEYTAVAVAGAGRSERRSRRVPAAGLDDVTLELRSRASLAVTVRGPDGAPVARAFVRLSGPVVRFESTGAAGEALFQPLDPGRYHLVASHRELGSVETEVDVEPAFGGPQRLELRLDSKDEDAGGDRFEVAGRVVDDSGLPVAGARVQLMGEGARAPAVSAADGRFALRAPAGEYRLACSHPDYAVAERLPLELAGDVAGLVLELSAGASVRGRISGLQLEDLARVVVVARGPLGAGAGVFERRYGTVDFSGELSIDGLAAGEWLVRAELVNPTRAAVERVTFAQGQRQARVELRFEPGYRLTGSVLGPAGPVAACTVTVACLGEFRGETFTGDDGRFAVDHVPAGRCTVSATDSRTGQQGRQQIELAADTDVVLEIGPGL